jgi:phosphatidylglycerophosphatase A
MTEPPENRPDPTGPSLGRTTLATLLATGLGVGWSPWASGTVGAAVWGMPLAYLLETVPLPARIVAILVISAVGIPICTVAVRALGGKKDPGTIVLDEIASLPITFFLVPMTTIHPVLVLIGFLLNRGFDIVKPAPARQLEHLPDGLGIMADDWVAGIYSCLALHLLIWLTG